MMNYINLNLIKKFKIIEIFLKTRNWQIRINEMWLYITQQWTIKAWTQPKEHET